jgi:uncharacterized membrane protein (UPF0127 family)
LLLIVFIVSYLAFFLGGRSIYLILSLFMTVMKNKEAEITFHTKNSKFINIKCEIASSFSQKMKGMMYRESLPGNHGMLFPFLIPWHRFFWMKNVKIPLDIIFINSKLEIIYIHEAPVKKGYFQKFYWSHGFCKYVIETNMGFCKKNDIFIGAKIQIN